MTASLITYNVNLTQENWCVTLVKRKENYHALLVFEGVKKNGKYFAKVAHIKHKTGKYYDCNNKLFGRVGVIEVKEFDRKFKNVYGAKTHTWVLRRRKLKKLIYKIEEQHELYQPFLILGRKSPLVTTAETYNIHDPVLTVIAQENEELFLKLYDSWKNEGKPTGMDEESFNHAVFEILSGVDQEELGIKDVDYTFNYMMDLFEKENMLCEEVFQHSCFTWACEQLSSVGINDVETKIGKFFSKIISATQLSTRYKPQSTGDHLVKDMTSEIDEKQEVDGPKEPAPIYRVVTYQKKRDKRTESYKKFVNEERKHKNKRETGIIESAFGVTSIIGGGILTVFSLPVAVPVICGGLVLTLAGDDYKKKHESKLNQIRNNQAVQNSWTENERQQYKKKINNEKVWYPVDVHV